MLSLYRDQREKLVKENSSNFVETFSRQCRDTGITTPGVKIVSVSKLYAENYAKIDWSN